MPRNRKRNPRPVVPKQDKRGAPSDGPTHADDPAVTDPQQENKDDPAEDPPPPPQPEPPKQPGPAPTYESEEEPVSVITVEDVRSSIAFVDSWPLERLYSPGRVSLHFVMDGQRLEGFEVGIDDDSLDVPSFMPG